jgi:hypothetical protein
MPLPTTFAGDSSRGEGQWTRSAAAPPQTYWITTYEDNINYSTSGNIPRDQIVTIKTDSSGNVYSLGNVTAIIGGTKTNDMVLMKQTASGTIAWAKGFVAPGGGAISGADMAIDRLGNIFTIDYSNNITKFDSSGSVVWAYTLTSTTSGVRLTDIIIASTDDIFIGFIYGASGSITGAGILKLNSSAVVQWATGYPSASGAVGGGYAQRQGIALDSNNNVFLGGYSPVKVERTFGTLQAALGNTSGNYGISAVTVDSSNNVYLAGAYYGSTNLGVILKLNNSFTSVLWGWTYAPTTPVSSSFNGFGAIAIDSSNNIIAGGTTYITGGGTWIGLAAKIANDGTGNLLATAYFANNSQAASGIGVLPSAQTIAIDLYGSIYFGGFVPTPLNDGAKIPLYATDAVIIKDQNTFATTHAGTYTMNGSVAIKWISGPDYAKQSANSGSANISPTVTTPSFSVVSSSMTTNNALTAGNQPGIVTSFVNI